MLSSKWILCSFLLITLFLSSVLAQPTPTPTSLVKRQEVETNSVNEFNKATVSRKSSSITKTATPTATETGKGNHNPAIIPAATTAWFGKFFIYKCNSFFFNVFLYIYI